ncbi:MAG: hypothetical protein IJ193_09215 [Bacilli bacterium]|nr:hypothetical protein [Bacilli bacterium]
MVNVDIYDIDGKEYMLLDRVTQKKNTYLYLSNVEEGNDYIIRKINPKNEEEMIPLDSEEEVKKAILLITNKQIEN